MDDRSPGAVGPSGGFCAGSQIAGYRLEEHIGQGGMAVVFRAHDKRLERQVALKILSPALATDEAFRHRFIRESRSAAAADDPHIIPVFEAGDADGVLFIAMRYVPGGDVGALVKRLGPLPIARAAAIISGVASALDAAHAAGLVHRDVKPSNMLLDARVGRPDHVYLSDFGLTKGAVSSADLTGSGHFMGTLNYCAPEQIQGRRVDARTDEYALACSAFVLLTGEPPFPRDEDMAVLYAQLSAPPPLLRSRRPGLPPTVDDVLQRALAKAPKDRYASCGEFADALRMALGLQRYASDAATVLRQRPLAHQQHGLGPDASAANANIVAAGQQAGNLDETPALHEQTLVDQLDRPEPGHPDALATKFLLAQRMAAEGDHAGAEKQFRHVLAARQRALGPDHPDTLLARFGVAQEMAALGDHSRAEEEFRAMLPYLRRKFGLDHPDTLGTRCSIGREMAARGDHAGAEREFRDVLPVVERRLGADHPVALILWVSIAREMAARGDHAGAEGEFRHVLPHLKRTLGADHPDTLAAFEWIYYLQGKMDDRSGEADPDPPARPGGDPRSQVGRGFGAPDRAPLSDAEDFLVRPYVTVGRTETRVLASTAP